MVNGFGVYSYPTIILIAPDRTIVKKQMWSAAISPDDLLDEVNNSILSAGGVPLLCSVDTEQIPFPQKQMLSAFLNSSGEVMITCHQELSPGMDLLVYSADGRLVYKQPMNNNVLNLSLKPGIYFAALLKDGSKISTLRFVSK